MKARIMVVLLAFCMLAGAQNIFAQHHFGITGGVDFSYNDAKEYGVGQKTSWHAGLTYQSNLGLGFSIQPSLLYHVKGARTRDFVEDVKNKTYDFAIGYLELPVAIQWGPDLLFLRPFVEVTPYIGYGLTNAVVTTDTPIKGSAKPEQTSTTDWNLLNRLEYGVGVGAGIEVWKLQIVARYNWALSPLGKNPTPGEVVDNVLATFKNNGNIRYVTLSVSLLF